MALLNTNYGYQSLELYAGDVVMVGLGGGAPVLLLDGFAITCADTATAYRLAVAAHEFAARVAAVAACKLKPCGTLDCCEFGATDCVSRVLATGEAS